MLFSVLTGIAAGAVHVVGGPDHLIAMAPTALKNPKLALKDSLDWGVGHAFGVLVLSLLALTFKDLVNIQIMSHYAEFAVGIVLLIVGFYAIKTAFGLSIHSHRHKHGSAHRHEHIHIHLRGSKKHKSHSHSLTSLGLLHGVAGGSHFLAVIPALALPPLGSIIYIASYLVGSILCMVAVVLAMSMASLKAGRKALPILMGFTGALSIITGIFWIEKTSNFLI